MWATSTRFVPPDVRRCRSEDRKLVQPSNFESLDDACVHGVVLDAVVVDVGAVEHAAAVAATPTTCQFVAPVPVMAMPSPWLNRWSPTTVKLGVSTVMPDTWCHVSHGVVSRHRCCC